MSSPSLVFPYVVEALGRRKPFTMEMEVASTFCLAELKRRKRGIRSYSSEKISFITKLHYPLWIIPWEEGSLVVDGLGSLSYNLTHLKTPKVKVFTEDLHRSTTAQELFRAVLKTHTETFREFNGATEVSVETIISPKKFLEEIFEYIKSKERKNEEPKKRVVLLPLIIDKTTAQKRSDELVNYVKQIQSEIISLSRAVDVLNEKTSYHEQKILCEIKQLLFTYDAELLKTRPASEKKVERLMIEKENRISKTRKATEKKLKAALLKRDKQKEQLTKFEHIKGDFETKREVRKRKGDKTGRYYWDRKIKNYKNKISVANVKIKSLSQIVEQIREQSEDMVKRVTRDYQAFINEEKKKTSSLEIARDNEIATKQKKIKQSRLESSSIVNLILKLKERKQFDLSKIEDLRMAWDPEEITLICMPFYLILYETKTKHRYLMLMPVKVMDDDGITKKIQKTIWSFSLRSRIKRLLRSRCKELEVLESAFTNKMSEDLTFKENVYKLGLENNLFDNPKVNEALVKGMDDLEKEGWISFEEKKSILQVYPPQLRE